MKNKQVGKDMDMDMDMEAFRYKGRKLYCEGVDTGRAARDAGTPLYLYSRGKIESNYKTLDTALSSIPHIICYAYKANSNLAICRILKGLGAGVDIVSGGELYKALKVGVNPKKIVFAGVGKTEEEIRYAIHSGILMFNVESVQELNFINEIAGRMSKAAPVAIRVNFGFDPDTHTYDNTGKGSKFGIEASIARGVYAYAKALRNVEIAGLHSHIGSQITDMTPFRKNLQMALRLARDLGKLEINLRYINVGGGFGIGYRQGESAISVSSLGRAFRSALRGSRYTLLLEPGRFIVGNAGALITKVLRIKKSFRKTFVVVDAGMNDFIRPALYEAYHHVQPVVGYPTPDPPVAGARVGVPRSVGASGRPVVPINVVGPVCETGDFLALRRKMRLPRQGELLAVMDAGAYGFEMSSNYNSRPRLAQVMVKGRRTYLIRKRDRYADLIRGEKV